MARASSGKLRDGDATKGAAGRGGSTEMLKGGSASDVTGCAAGDCGTDTVMGSVTVALYRDGSAGTAPAAEEDCGAEVSARRGLTGRHSSSKVTERLEITVLDAG